MSQEQTLPAPSARKAYDPKNIFAKILKGEIPCNKVYEDSYILAFHDIHPKAPTHVLVIPKGYYVSYDDFTAHASADEIAAFFKGVGLIAQKLGMPEDGFRLVSNSGLNGGQEVPHFHVHLLAGRAMGPLPS